MPLCCGWLQSPAISSSAKKVLNVPQTSASSVESRARLRAFLACILVAADFAHPRLRGSFLLRTLRRGRTLSAITLTVKRAEIR